jgi:hypothetical protein
MTNERTQPRELLQLHRRVEEIWNTTEENQGSEGARIVENAVDKNRSRSRADCARYNRFEWNETRMHGQHSAHCKRTGIAFQGEQLVLVRAVFPRVLHRNIKVISWTRSRWFVLQYACSLVCFLLSTTFISYTGHSRSQTPSTVQLLVEIAYRRSRRLKSPRPTAKPVCVRP